MNPLTHEPDRLFVDVDTGIDDALALLYACAGTQTLLVGVSTVVGNVSLANATRNTRAVLALAGRTDVPVHPGAAMPLAPEPNDARAVHGATGLGYASLPDPVEPVGLAHGVDALVAAAHAHAGRLILVATGPLTNVALAAMREPELPRLVKRFVIMGGAYLGHGNVTPSAEFNIWHDPEAARIVFRAFGSPGGAPVIAVGLDVTRKTTIDADDLGALAARCGENPRALALMRFVEDSARYYFERMERQTGRRFLIMHDPLALAVALDPSLIETRRAYVDVETAGRLTTGATVADWDNRWGRPANTEIAVAVDAERFRATFFEAIVRLAVDGVASGHGAP